MTSTEAKIGSQPFKTVLSARNHENIADEPEDLGGQDLGFTPDELLASALGSCTAITLKMYATRKGWPLSEAIVEVSFEREKGSSSTKINRQITLVGELDDEQRQRLLQIANACPVHKTLSNPIEIITSL
jgi:putative redox protein